MRTFSEDHWMKAGAASEGRDMFREFRAFAGKHKMIWIMPIVLVVVALIGVFFGGHPEMLKLRYTF